MPRYTGKGKDRKGVRRDGLKLAWRWPRVCDYNGNPHSNDTRRIPCETCFAEIKVSGHHWKFKAISCGDSYDATLELYDNLVLRIKDLPDRLDAQQFAERLLNSFLRDTLKETNTLLP